MNDYKWGIAMLDYAHPSDLTKRLESPKICLMYVRAEANSWDTKTKDNRQIPFNPPWTFNTRKEAREVAAMKRKTWGFSKHIKIRVVKFYTTIQGDL